MIADCTHRLHFAKDKDYDSFYSAENILDDEPIEKGIDFIEACFDPDDIMVFTGRPYRAEKSTRAWLALNAPFLANADIKMRKNGDYRPSPIVKVETMQTTMETIAREYDSVIFLDDDPQNVKAVCEAYPEVVGLVFGTERYIC